MSTLISRLYNWVTDKANGVKITASRNDDELNQQIVALNRKVLCSGSAPGSPIAGQTWVDTTNKFLKLYRNNEWVIQGIVHVATAAPTTPQEGDLWWDSTNNLLYVYDGATQRAVSTTNSILEGTSSGRNILRMIFVEVSAGGTPGTNINTGNAADSSNGYNAAALTDATNLAKNASSGSFALSSDGLTLTITMPQTVVGVIAATIVKHRVKNSSITAGDTYYAIPVQLAGKITLSFRKTGNDALVDIMTMLTTSGDKVAIYLAYVSST